MIQYEKLIERCVRKHTITCLGGDVFEAKYECSGNRICAVRIIGIESVGNGLPSTATGIKDGKNEIIDEAIRIGSAFVDSVEHRGQLDSVLSGLVEEYITYEAELEANNTSTGECFIIKLLFVI